MTLGVVTNADREGLLRTIGRADLGTHPAFSRSVAAHNEPAPVPGGHTAAVLERFLRMDADEVARYRAEGIL